MKNTCSEFFQKKKKKKIKKINLTIYIYFKKVIIFFKNFLSNVAF